MNWFERHLNWTAVIAPIVFSILVFLTIYIFYFFSPTPMEYMDHPPVDLMVLLTIAFLLVLSIWILVRKRRSIWFLLFFFLPLIILSTCYIDNKFYIFKSSSVSDFIYDILFPAGIFLWLSGWVLIILLKNKSVEYSVGFVSEVKNNNKAKILFNSLINKTLHRYPRLKYVPWLIIITIVIMGFIAGNSYTGRDTSYISYLDTIKPFSSNITYSFEYPRCFDLTQAHNWSKPDEVTPADHAEIILRRGKFSWFIFSYYGSVITIDALRVEEEGRYYEIFYGEEEEEEEEDIYRLELDPDTTVIDRAKARYFKASYFTNNINEVNILDTKEIVISGIQAEYVVISEQVKNSHSWHVLKFVYFRYNDLVWIINGLEDNLENDFYFNHLLETFTITE